MIYVEEGEEVYTTETVYNSETGLPRRQTTRLNGMLHAPPDGSPSQVAWDDQARITHKYWHVLDLEHRIDNPSSIVFRPDGTRKTECFMIHGKPRPADQGAYIVRLDKSGTVWDREFDEGEGNSNTPTLAP